MTPNANHQPEALLSQKAITARGGLSRSYLYKLVALGKFPEPAVRHGRKFTRWHASAVDDWFADPAKWLGNTKAADTTA